MPATAFEGETITLMGSVEDVGTADTHTLAWAFGDGATAIGESVAHNYGDNGTYVVSLTASDDDGGQHVSSANIVVANVAPAADAGMDLSGVEGSIVAFNVAVLDPGNDTHTYQWDFGDGATTSGATPVHVFADNGTYGVFVLVQDDDGGTGSDSLTVVVDNVVPIAEAGANLSVPEGSEHVFNGSFTDPGADTHSVSWTFGDGSTGTGLTPGHAYIDNGTFNVVMTVVDDDGGSHSDNLEVLVTNVAPVAVALADQTVESGGVVDIDVIFSDTGVQDTHTVSIDWGDGIAVELPVAESEGQGDATGSRRYLD